MKSGDQQRIYHIKRYCEEISETIHRFGRSFEQFASDKDYFKSVSMSIMQIGELSGGLSDDFKQQTATAVQWGPIKAMRNMFAHGYASMEPEIIWETAVRDVPALLSFCDKMLEDDHK